MGQPTYHLRNIRKLLTAAFTDAELRQLCYDTPEFRLVYEQFAMGMGKDQMIQLLIEYCERKVLMGHLLTVIQEEAPDQYALFADDLIVGGKRAQPAPLSISTSEPDESKFLQEMITTKTRNLQHLQLQAARYGISLPPHIAVEIEDLQKEIDDLRQKLELKP